MKRPARKRIEPLPTRPPNPAKVVWERNGFRIVRSPMAVYVERKAWDAVGEIAWLRIGDWMLGGTFHEELTVPQKLVEALLLSAVGEEVLD